MNELYQALISLIIAQFDTEYPLINTAKFHGRPIFVGYQNDYAVLSNGKYVIITLLNEENQILNPNSIPSELIGTQTFTTLLSSIVQIDFYGENSSTNSRGLQLLLNSNYADNYWIDNQFNCSVNKVYEIINLTDKIGRDLFLSRHMLKCSLFNNPLVTTPLVVYDGIDNTIRLADIQK